MDDARGMMIDTLEQMQEHLVWGLEDLSEQQRYFVAGACNPIAYTAFHMSYGLDRVCQAQLQGKPLIWQAKGYWQKLGLGAEPRSFGLSQEEQAAMRIEPWEELVNYVKDVLGGTLAYLRDASDGDLGTILQGARVDSLHTGDYSKIRTFRGRVTQVSLHMGEIFAIRGMLGLKGSPV